MKVPNEVLKTRYQIAVLLADGNLPNDRLAKILDLAYNPPNWIQQQDDRDKWADVVLRGRHDSYGGAVAHFHRSLAKAGREQSVGA